MWEYRCHWRWHQSSQGTNVWEIAPPSASGTETSLSGWGTFHEWMQRRIARFWQTLSFLDWTAPHARSDHTRGERAYWCKLRLTLQCVKAPGSSPLWSEFLELLWKILFLFFFRLWKTSFSTDFFAEEKVKLCAEPPFVVISSFFEKYPSPASQKVVFWSPFFVEFCFRKCRLSKKIFSWTLNFFYLLLIFFIFCLKKQTLLQFFNCPLNFQFFVLLPPETILKQIDFLQISFFLQTLFFELFLEEDIFWTKKLFKNYH